MYAIHSNQTLHTMQVYTKNKKNKKKIGCMFLRRGVFKNIKITFFFARLSAKLIMREFIAS